MARRKTLLSQKPKSAAKLGGKKLNGIRVSSPAGSVPAASQTVTPPPQGTSAAASVDSSRLNDCFDAQKELQLNIHSLEDKQHQLEQTIQDVLLKMQQAKTELESAQSRYSATISDFANVKYQVSHQQLLCEKAEAWCKELSEPWVYGRVLVPELSTYRSVAEIPEELPHEEAARKLALGERIQLLYPMTQNAVGVWMKARFVKENGQIEVEHVRVFDPLNAIPYVGEFHVVP